MRTRLRSLPHLSALALTLAISFSAVPLAVMVGSSVMVASCGPKKIVDVTAKTGLALATSIGNAQVATHDLTEQHLAAFPPEKAIVVQRALLKANDEVGKLPQFIRLAATAEAIQAGASTSTPAQVDAWLTILRVVSEQLGLAVGGLPVDSVARKALEASRQAQTTATTFIAELEKLKASLKQE